MSTLKPAKADLAYMMLRFPTPPSKILHHRLYETAYWYLQDGTLQAVTFGDNICRLHWIPKYGFVTTEYFLKLDDTIPVTLLREFENA